MLSVWPIQNCFICSLWVFLPWNSFFRSQKYFLCISLCVYDTYFLTFWSVVFVFDDKRAWVYIKITYIYLYVGIVALDAAFPCPNFEQVWLNCLVACWPLQTILRQLLQGVSSTCICCICMLLKANMFTKILLFLHSIQLVSSATAASLLFYAIACQGWPFFWCSPQLFRLQYVSPTNCWL